MSYFLFRQSKDISRRKGFFHLLLFAYHSDSLKPDQKTAAMPNTVKSQGTTAGVFHFLDSGITEQ